MYKRQVLNLNPACKLADTSWIKPGKVFRSGDLKQDRVTAAIDFAAERGIQYVHMEAGWYGPETVSYTHLDVYKRQTQHIAYKRFGFYRRVEGN